MRKTNAPETIYRHTILIVDDTVELLWVLQNILSSRGYNILTAMDGKEAVARAIEHQPDLILLDIQLPEMNGFDVMSVLKTHHETAYIPIILITGMGELNSKIKGFQMGAVDYITKPFQMEEVEARINIHVKLSFTTRQLIAAQKEKLQQIQTAQRALLITPKEIPDAQFCVYLNQLQEAGGDFYDVVEISPLIHGYFIADVAGHDISSGFITPAIKALLKQNCTVAFRPAESMHMVNEVLIGMLPEGKYLTAAWLVINRATMNATLISMAHPNVILKRKNGTVEILKSQGDILGVFKDVIYTEQTIDIHKGDRFYIYTDGIIEGTGIADVWTAGVDILAEHIRKLPHTNTPQEDVDLILREIHSGEQLTDDLLLMCTEV